MYNNSIDITFTNFGDIFMDKKNSFILYDDYAELVNELDNERAGKLFKSLFRYTTTGEVPEMDSLLKMVFITIRQGLDRNAEKYSKIVEKRRAAGSIGGKTRAQNQAKEANAIFDKQTQANQADNDSDNDSVSVSVSVSDNVSDNDSVLSLSVENIKEEERKVLENYVKRNKLAKKNVRAYVNKIIQNGDALGILKEERERDIYLRKTADEIYEDEIKSVKDKRSAAKVLYKYYSRGSSPPPAFEGVMEKYDLDTYDKLYQYAKELGEVSNPPPTS